MAQYKNPCTITTSTGGVFTFRASLIEGFPEARAFLEDVIARGVSEPVAAHYVKLAARLRKNGRLNQPNLIVHNVERTAANAYHRWRRESYAGRVQLVVRGFADGDVHKGVSWLRRSSLVPPYPGKVIRRLAVLSQIHLDPETRAASMTPATYTETPCTAWTLHVPHAPVAVHQDPCADCAVIELDAVKLELIAQAFEQAWGHRDLNRVPMECFLFGEPPPADDAAASAVTAKAIGKVVALLPPGALASALDSLGGMVSDRPEVFAARAVEGADVLVVARVGLGDERFADAVESLSGIAREAAREKGAG